MPERSPFPFVVGCGRSGTTLVRALLDAHPQLAVPDESYFPAWFGRVRSRYERPDGFARDRLVTDLLAHESFRRWGLDATEVRDAIARAEPETFADTVRAYYAAYARAHRKPRYADKTPIFALHMPELAEIFEESVFVHVVRDGRDVVLSRMEAAWGTHRVDFEALQWRSHIRTARADGSRLGPGRYREFRYEALLDDPEQFARELCAFIRLDFDPTMLRYHERAQPLVEAMAYPEEHKNLLNPPTKGLRDWRVELTGTQLALIEELAGDTLPAFGYERVTGPAPIGIRARALEARARYTSTMQFRRARAALWHALHRDAMS